jgi:hypothetical protein
MKSVNSFAAAGAGIGGGHRSMCRRTIRERAAQAAVSLCSLRLVAITVTIIILVPFSSAFGQVVIAHDEFTTAHNFTDGAGFSMSDVGAWTGGYNMAFGSPNTFASSGGVLTIDSTGTDFGWNDTRSDAPFLYVTIPAGQAHSPESFDFRATVKITAQTAASFGVAGLLARSPAATPPAGTAGGSNADENWFHSGNLRFAGASDTNGNSRNRMRQVGAAQISSDNPWSAALVASLPGGYSFAADGIWVRMQRDHNSITGLKEYTTWMSADGVTFFQQGTTVTPQMANPLNNGALAVEVGLVLNTFSVTNPFQVSFDEFTLEIGEPPQACTVCEWNAGSGDWSVNAHWTGDVSSATFAPSGNTITAVFGNGSGSPGSQVVFTNSNVTVKTLQLDSTTRSYVLAGAGQITLEADSGDALIDVLDGDHEIQVDLALGSNTTASAATGSTLNVNAPIHLNGNTLVTSGDGTINLNVGAIAGGGGGGGLVNSGSLVGLASVEGDFAQSAGGALGVVVGGSAIEVSGEAVLGGELSLSLADGLRPAMGQSFTVLTAESVTDAGLALSGSAAGLFRLDVGGGAVTLTAVPEPASGTALIVLTSLALAGFRRALGAR